MIKVWVAIPTQGSIGDFQVATLREIEKRYASGVKLVYPAMTRRRSPVDHARNEMVKEFLASDCQIMWFLDSDNCPNGKVMELVTMHRDKWKLAGCPVPMWTASKEENKPWLCFNAFDWPTDADKPKPVQHIIRHEQMWMDGLATACLFIKREVFESIPYPWFKNIYDPMTLKLVEGEDFYFIRRCRERKLKFLVDWGLVCRHEKLVDLFEVFNWHMEQTNAAFEAGQLDERAAWLQKEKEGKIIPLPKAIAT